MKPSSTTPSSEASLSEADSEAIGLIPDPRSHAATLADMIAKASDGFEVGTVRAHREQWAIVIAALRAFAVSESVPYPFTAVGYMDGGIVLWAPGRKPVNGALIYVTHTVSKVVDCPTGNEEKP